MQASVRLQPKVRDDISQVARMTNRIEILRKQLEDQQKAQGGAGELLTAMEAIDEKLLAVERELISRSDSLSDDKYYVEAAKLYLNLLWLHGSIGTGTGKFAGSGDYAQTGNRCRSGSSMVWTARSRPWRPSSKRCWSTMWPLIICESQAPELHLYPWPNSQI